MKIASILQFSILALLLAACQSRKEGSRDSNASGGRGTTATARSAQEGALKAAQAGFQRLYSFDHEEVDLGPEGFSFERTGKGPPGRWVVRHESDAPSPPGVLAQLDSNPTDFRFPLAILKELNLVDLSLRVRCKAFWGRVDQVCGLVARYQDPDNYYVARSNALENNVRLYVMKDGQRKELAEWNGEITSEAWHDLRFDLRGDRLEVYWDGKKVLEHRDSSFKEAGRAGLWTKADANSYFDNFEVIGK